MIQTISREKYEVLFDPVTMDAKVIEFSSDGRSGAQGGPPTFKAESAEQAEQIYLQTLEVA